MLHNIHPSSIFAPIEHHFLPEAGSIPILRRHNHAIFGGQEVKAASCSNYVGQ